MILIKDGKIQEVGKDIKCPEKARIIDAKGKIVMPGFIDAHCHLGIFEEGIGFEGSDGNESVDPVTPHLRAIDAINPMDISLREAYEGGVTTAITGPGSANVIGGTFAAIKTYGSRIDNMIIKDPIAMKIAFGENPKNVYNSQKKSPITRMATAEIVGLSERIGSIEKGKDADIVIFDGNPIKDINHKTYMTIIDGKIVYEK